MSDVIVKAVATVKAVGDPAADGPGEFEVILATPALDREGDTLLGDEWVQPFPDRITFDIDHGMSVATTVGSGVPTLDEQGRILVRGTYASTPLAQQTRTLVNEGHITKTSVAFLQRSVKVDGKNVVRRELLNGAFVAVPANMEADVLSSKSAAAAVDEVNAEAQARAVVKAIAGSYEERQQAVYEAVADLYRDDWRTWAYLVGTTETEAVWRVHCDDEALDGEWRATYTLDEATFEVTLGEPVKVRVVEVVTEIPAPPNPESSPKSLSPDPSPDAAAVKAAAPGEESGAVDDAALDEQQEIARAKALANSRALSLLGL